MSWARPVIGLIAVVAPAAAAPAPLVPQEAWHLRGGLLTGGFVPAKARQDWPRWMQILVGGAPVARIGDLQGADLRKVPDQYLPRAVQTLQANGVFSQRLMGQVVPVLHAAPAKAWQAAKTDYLVAGVEALGLPQDDPLLWSRTVTQLVQEGQGAVVRRALEGRPFKDEALQASLLRRLELAMGKRSPSPEVVQDRRLPLGERLHHLSRLKAPQDTPGLVGAFRGSGLLTHAVHLAVQKGWLDLGHALVEEALSAAPGSLEAGYWIETRPADRRADLRWERLCRAVEAGRNPRAEAQALLAESPASVHAGAAAALLGQGTPELRTPGDVTVFSAPFIAPRLRPVGTTWPEPWRALAASHRYDLILAKVDPEAQGEVFLQAAHAAGQIDLAGRHLAGTRSAAPETLAALLPTALAPLVAKLLREEGVEALVDPAFVLAMMKNESLFQPGAHSPANAFGLLQLLRPTFRAMMGRQADIHDPITNLRGGLRYYRRVGKVASLEELPRQVREAYICAGYHAGEGRAKRWRLAIEGRLQGRTDPASTLRRLEAVPIRSTRLYIARVLGDAELYRVLLRPAPTSAGR